MKQRLNKNTHGIFSPAAPAALLALLLVPLFFSGCNSGLGVLTYLLDDDKEANLTAAEGVAVVFDGFEDASLAANVNMGRWAWGSGFVDINGDGWDDLVVANGYITTEDTGDL